MPDLEYRAMRGGEREGLLDLLEAAFHERDVFVRYLDSDPDLRDRDTLLALDRARPVSSVQIFTKRIRLRGETVLLGGIGSVATHPDYERNGIATRLLRLAIEEMKRRGMALSLLFTGRISFYERLDWVQIPCPMWAVHRGESERLAQRPFRASDLPAVKRLYDAYSRGLDAVTVRDDAYWRAQLRYAGTPGEEFRIAERNGVLRAYARGIELFGTHQVMEYARAPDAAAELAALLVDLAPPDAALIVPRTPDRELETELQSSAAGLDAIELRERMWRVLDRSRLLDLSGRASGDDDAELLRALVGTDQTVYWTSDRF
jgi:predicted N-acetyltransferase YhbS